MKNHKIKWLPLYSNICKKNKDYLLYSNKSKIILIIRYSTVLMYHEKKMAAN